MGPEVYALGALRADQEGWVAQARLRSLNATLRVELLASRVGTQRQAGERDPVVPEGSQTYLDGLG